MSQVWTKTGRVVRGGGIAVAALFLASCGYAKKDFVQGELDRMRGEMQSGDQALAGRIDQVEGRVSALERELQAFRNDFNVKMQRFEELIAFDVPVHFDFAKAEVRSSDQAVLDRFAAVVRNYYPNAIITVEGFTDPAGSAAYNLKLGKARADAVLTYLTTNGGLNPEQVRSVSYGKATDRQIVKGASGATNPAAMANRRVSLVIDYSGTIANMATEPVTD
jgi:peptidoglycan-associated lipoprotein